MDSRLLVNVSLLLNFIRSKDRRGVLVILIIDSRLLITVRAVFGVLGIINMNSALTVGTSNLRLERERLNLVCRSSRSGTRRQTGSILFAGLEADLLSGSSLVLGG